MQAALAVLENEYPGEDRVPKVVGLWNGIIEGFSSAAVSLDMDGGPLGDSIDLTIGGAEMAPPWLGNMAMAIGVTAALARTYEPYYVTTGSTHYFSKAVFDDKPGVNWMLYLPRVLTAQQVPEAAALVAVDDARGRRLGTIVVSVADEVFSADNPRHVEAANHIEIRLVDQDLLPRYADFRR